MSGPHAELLEVALSDRRYAVEAYEFLCQALARTQEMLGIHQDPDELEGADPPPVKHVTGQELLEGIRLHALEQYGMMTPAVFRLWGIRTTADFGAMVYRLIDAGLWHKSPNDRIEHFEAAYDFEKVFVNEYKLEWDDL